MKDNKEYFQDIILYDYIDVITDYHSNGAYQKLKENVTLKYEEDYAIMVRTLNFEANNFASNLIYINEKEYNFLSKSKVYENDILMNKIANAGSVYVMPKHNKPTSLAMNLFLIRFNNLLNQKYMYYLMKTNEAYIKNFANGTSTLTITKESVKNLKFQVPSLLIQNKIASILSNLDKKIELNNQINQKLESMAKTLYDYWFVQFDFPDDDGKPYKSSGGKMVYSEELKRGIPEGWEVFSLSSIVKSNYKSITKNDIFEEIEYLDTSSLTRNQIDVTEHLKTDLDKIPSRAKRIINTNDILYSTVRPNLCHYGIIKYPIKNMIASTGFVQLSTKVDWLSNDLIYTFLTSSWITSRLQQVASLSVSSYPSISANDILELNIVLPKEGKGLDFINTKLDNIYSKISLNQIENQKLTQLRDWLLPMLMNGQVGVESK